MTTSVPLSRSLRFSNLAVSECYDGDHDDANDGDHDDANGPPLHISISAIMTMPFFSFSNRSLTLIDFLIKSFIADGSGSLVFWAKLYPPGKMYQQL